MSRFELAWLALPLLMLPGCVATIRRHPDARAITIGGLIVAGWPLAVLLGLGPMRWTENGPFATPLGWLEGRVRNPVMTLRAICGLPAAAALVTMAFGQEMLSASATCRDAAVCGLAISFFLWLALMGEEDTGFGGRIK